MNKNIELKRKLPTPEELREELPLSKKAIEIKEKKDKEIRDIFCGNSDKFLLIIGPCSADRIDSVMDYVKMLLPIQEEVKDHILIIPRIYTGKPRTVGTGYKGMVHQPDPNGAPNVVKGIKAIRELHRRVLEETGFCSADEMLYPENYRYLSDILSYVAVGARSVEDQEHRLVASGMSVPVGMKNPVSGDLTVMLNSVRAAQSGHTFIYDGWEVESKGNDMVHTILRGSVDKFGINHANYHYEDLKALYDMYCNDKFKNPAVIIDTNHSNSGKRYEEQIRIAKDVLYTMKQNPEMKKIVKGLMIESYIEDGAQNVDEGIYGKSITDPCLGIEKTKDLIYKIADRLSKL